MMNQYFITLILSFYNVFCFSFRRTFNPNTLTPRLQNLKRNAIEKDMKYASIKSTNTNSTENNGRTYLNNINGASNVVLLVDKSTKTKQYIPKDWIDSNNNNITPEDKWLWLQERQTTEKILKNAIASNITNIQDHFTEYESYLSLDQADILQKNYNFYSFLNNNDVDGIRSLWLDSNDTICVPSGMNSIVTGYRNIVNWLSHSLNENPRILYNPKNISLQYFGNIAIVTSFVDTAIVKSNNNNNNNNRNKLGILSKTKNNKIIISPFYSTNIFVKLPDSDTYLLTTHIGSPHLLYDSKEAKKLRSVYRDPSIKPPSGMGGGGSGPRTQVISIQDMQNMFNNRFGGNYQGNGFETNDDDDEEENDDNEEDDDDEDGYEDDDEEENIYMSGDGSSDDLYENDDDNIENANNEDDDDDDDEEDSDEVKVDGITYRRAQTIKAALKRALRTFGMNPLSSSNNKDGGPKIAMTIINSGNNIE